MTDIDKAIEYLDSLEPGEIFSYTKVAEKFGVVRSTLTRRYQGISTDRKAQKLHQYKLTAHEEAELVQYIEKLTERHLPPTRDMIQNFASHIAKRDVSESWVTRFLNRHSSEIFSRWATGMDQDRHAADSMGKYKLYFDLLERKIAHYSVESRHIYNMDEKGFMLGIVGRSKRVFSKAMYKQKRVRESLQDGNREWITLLATVCADGTALSPGIIFQSANSTLQSS